MLPEEAFIIEADQFGLVFNSETLICASRCILKGNGSSSGDDRTKQGNSGGSPNEIEKK